MIEDEQANVSLEEEVPPTKSRGLWKTIIIVVVVGLILLIAMGFIRHWMVSSYGGW